MKRTLLALLLITSVPAMADELKPGPGKDVTEAGCSTCHTTAYIPMNSPFLTPEVWKAEITKMRNVFGAPIDDDAAAAILTYLTTAYGAPPE